MLSKNAFSLILLSNVIIGLAICSPLALPKAISLGIHLFNNNIRDCVKELS